LGVDSVWMNIVRTATATHSELVSQYCCGSCKLVTHWDLLCCPNPTELRPTFFARTPRSALEIKPRRADEVDSPRLDWTVEVGMNRVVLLRIPVGTVTSI
jgi:hypothetical protein